MKNKKFKPNSKDAARRAKIIADIKEYVDSNNAANKKRIDKGIDEAISIPLTPKGGHRGNSENHGVYGGLDVGIAHLPDAVQYKFAEHMVNKGHRVYDERDDISKDPKKRKLGLRAGIVHIDDHLDEPNVDPAKNYVKEKGLGMQYNKEFGDSGTHAAASSTGGGGGGSCFIAGTLVTMADGSHKVIEKVLIGEQVRGLDGIVNTVMEYNRPPLAISALGEVRKLYSVNEEKAFFTDEHPFYTTTGWKSLNPKATQAELNPYTVVYPELVETTVMKVGDKLVTENGMVEIKSIEEYDADFYTQLYNFILDGDHTYRANGYVVHNGGKSTGSNNKPSTWSFGSWSLKKPPKPKAAPSTAAERRGEYGEDGREMDDGKTDVQGGSRGKFERDLAKEVKKGEMKRKLFGGALGAVAGPLAGKAFNKLSGPYTESDAAAHMAGMGPKPPRGSGGSRHGGSSNIGHVVPRGGSAAAATPAPAPKPEVPKTPSQMTEAELEAMLAKRAKGEDSIVDKQAKLARERGLAQQLSSIRGARGATAGQKLRALQRGGSKMGVELGAQTAIAKAQEQEAAQKALLGLKRGDRQRAEEFAQKKEFAKYQQDIGAAPGIAAAGQQQKRDQWGNIIKTGKKIWDVGKGLGELTGWWEEGGKVEGPGSETSDSIPAQLSDGEFVVKASAVRGLGKQLGAKDKKDQRKKGVEFLYKLQDKMDKKVEKFGGGGSVESKNEKLRKRQKLLAKLKAAKVKVTIKKPKKKKLSVDDLIDMPFAKGGEIKADPERFLKFMDKGVSWSLNKKNIQKSHLPKEKKKALLEKLGEEPKFAKGGESAVKEWYERLDDPEFKEPKSKPQSRDKLIGPLRIGMIGPGKMSDEERKKASKIKGKDPKSFFDDKTSLKVKKLMKEIDKRTRSKLKGKFPKSKNEEKVKKLLERNMAKGGEAYVRPKKAFREAIGYEPESRFHDKAEKDAKFGGARRKFRHFKHGGEASYGDVIAAQKDLNRRLEKLEKRK